MIVNVPELLNTFALDVINDDRQREDIAGNDFCGDIATREVEPSADTCFIIIRVNMISIEPIAWYCRSLVFDSLYIVKRMFRKSPQPNRRRAASRPGGRFCVRHTGGVLPTG